MNSFKSIIKHPLFISAVIVGLSASVLFSLPMIRKKAIVALPKSLPKYGWTLCEDLGVGEVPDFPPRQRFRMCAENSWQTLAHCLDESFPAPPVGSACELYQQDTFWCGDEYQLLRVYQVLLTPSPVPTATETLTPTPTYTTTPTPTHTPTTAPTNTPTAQPAFAGTQTQAAAITSVPSATATQRPKMGGSSGFETMDVFRILLGALIIGSGTTIALKDWLRDKKTP